jgi:hypothetical protein
MVNRAGAKLVFLSILLILAGCATSHVANEVPLDPNRIPPFKPKGSVNLINAQRSSKIHSIFLSNLTVRVNYNQYTEIVLSLVKNELRNKGVQVSRYGSKEIEVAVVDLQILPAAGTFRCFINYTVRTGDGYMHGNEAVGASWNYQTAIDAAVASAAVGVLNNENVLDYLEK